MLIISILYLQPAAAYAQNTGVAAELSKASCADLSGVGWFLGCPILTAVSWMVFAALMFVSAMFQVFGIIFDLVTAFTLDPATYNLDAIYKGWTIARDSANLFFIFILLTIAIATILQVDTFGVKKLLPRLIIAALFINFSFLLTQYVVFSSNLMTGFFLPGGAQGKSSASLSVKFLAGLNPNQMFKSAKFGFSDISKIQEQLASVTEKLIVGESAPEDPGIKKLLSEEESLRKKLETAQKDLPNTLIQMTVAMLGVTVFILVAIFALAFAGLSLLIRVVILWFLMILSPVAFLFYAIPGLDSYARQWWSTLLKQAFFAPAFFFLFGVTVEMIASGKAKDLLTGIKGGQAESTAFVTSFSMIAYYLLLIIMLMASVLVAKQMGGKAAEWAEKGVKSARKWAVGYAGTVGKRYTAPIAKTIAESETRAAKFVRSMPFVGRGITKASTLDQPEIKRYTQQYSSYSTDTLKNLKTSRLQFLNRARREAIEKVLDERSRKAKRAAILNNPKATVGEKINAMNESLEEVEKMSKQKAESDKEKKNK